MPHPLEDAPRFTGIFPRGGPAVGGTSVTISGHGLSRVTWCRFGEAPRTLAILTNSSRVVCSTPPANGLVEGGTPCSFLVAGRWVTDTGIRFHYYQLSPLLGIEPTNGQAGEEVKLYANNLGQFPFAVEDGRCKFGEAVVHVRRLAADFLSCRSPAGAIATEVAVSFTLNGVDYAAGQTTRFEFVKRQHRATRSGVAVTGLPMVPGTVTATVGSGQGARREVVERIQKVRGVDQ